MILELPILRKVAPIGPRKDHIVCIIKLTGDMMTYHVWMIEVLELRQIFLFLFKSFWTALDLELLDCNVCFIVPDLIQLASFGHKRRPMFT
jgi:hypothetical protein